MHTEHDTPNKGRDSAEREGVLGKIQIVVLEPTDPRQVEDDFFAYKPQSYSFQSSEDGDTISNSIGSIKHGKTLNMNKSAN